MAANRPKIANQIGALWKRLTPGRRVAAVTALLASVFAVGYVAYGPSSEEYATLFSGLTPEDAGAVVKELDSLGVPYRLAANGTIVSVPSGRVHEVRLALASNGLPRGGGVGFEVFDDQSFGTSRFVEKINYRRALQGELARTISSLDAVANARVHIAMGERSVFRDADNPPSASVALRLRGGRRLATPQVRGVVNLVASSVDGLRPERVVVVDDHGTVLAAGDDGAHVDAQRTLEQSLAHRAQKLIETIVGPGHATVVVTADMDFQQTDRTEERYDTAPPVVRSEVVTSERVGGRGNVGGIAGARGNLPGAGAPSGGAGTDGLTRTSETRNYELNRVVTRTQSPDSRIKRLHAAVLVDYAPAADEKSARQPREKQVLERITAIAREALGIDTGRGDSIEIHSVPFAPLLEAPEGEPVAASGWPVPPHLVVGAGATLVALIALVTVFVPRRRGRALAPDVLALPATVSAVERAMESELSPGEDAALKGLAAPSLHDRVAQSAKQDSQRAAYVLQGWLREPGGRG